MSQFFTSQEHFYKFKAAWATAVQSPKSKHYCKRFNELLPVTTYTGSTDGLSKTSNGHYWKTIDTGMVREQGWVRSEHMMLYNILRGKPLHTGFNPIVSPIKMNEWTSNMNTFYLTVIALENRVRWARELVADKKAMTKYREEHGVLTVVEKLTAFVKGVNCNADVVNNERFIQLVTEVRGFAKKPNGILSAGMRSINVDRVDEFLEPFAGTVTIEMLANIDEEQLKMISMFNSRHKPTYWMKTI